MIPRPLLDPSIALIPARQYKSQKVYQPLGTFVHGLPTSIEYLNGQSPTVHIPTWAGDCVEIAKS
jgi:hypothetical protein